jgi:hypothetical protein
MVLAHQDKVITVEILEQLMGQAVSVEAAAVAQELLVVTETEAQAPVEMGGMEPHLALQGHL